MKTFAELRESLELKEASYSQVQKFVFDKLENSDMDIDELEDAVTKKFGKASVKMLHKAMSEFMD